MQTPAAMHDDAERAKGLGPAKTAPWIPIVLRAGCFALLLAQTEVPVRAQGWPNYARDAQHTAVSDIPSEIPEVIRWSTPVDLQPQYTGSDLYIHYGSPVITENNTVIVPVKTGTTDSFEVQAYSYTGSSANLLWTLSTDYSVPACSWIPICGVTLLANNSLLAVPAGGGTVLLRTSPDSHGGTATRLAFYGIANYDSNPAAFNGAIKICTPITSDWNGNLYFGFISTGAALPGYPSGILSGLARVSSSGAGSFVAASAMSSDSAMQAVLYNCAPALSLDQTKLYVAVSGISPASPNAWGSGYLCELDAATLATQASVSLLDPRGTGSAEVTNLASATPTVGPDGDVYFGVLEKSVPSNHDRGWLLHYSGDLATTKLPSAFGWDDTASVVPSSAVPSYNGPSGYLLLTKYNNYAGAGGDGINKLAIVDPGASMTDPITGASVMATVLTVAGVTPDPEYEATLPGAVREWCINSAAVDPAQQCAVVNSEDGKVYRWDFTSNTLSAGLALATATGEAYTPTAVGPDGAVYAINDATLFSAGAVSAGPTITAQPVTQGVAAGSPVTLTVDATGAGLSYQWYLNGSAVSGATSSSLTVSSAQASDAGSYFVTVSDAGGTAISATAIVAVFQGLAATHAVVGSNGYFLTITNTLDFAGTPDALGWEVLLPAGWSFASESGSGADVLPQLGDTMALGWAWYTIPSGPVTFTYTVMVPFGSTGSQEISAQALFREGGPEALLAVGPDPLTVNLAIYHSADESHDYELDLGDLTRVIELYNTHSGSLRTGCYLTDPASEDGFNPDPSRPTAAAFALPYYHSADETDAGNITLAELTRVIELFNTKAGSTRTGQYHVAAGTEDGFAPGP
jgi:hypothetical protein